MQSFIIKLGITGMLDDGMGLKALNSLGNLFRVI